MSLDIPEEFEIKDPNLCWFLINCALELENHRQGNPKDSLKLRRLSYFLEDASKKVWNQELNKYGTLGFDESLIFGFTTPEKMPRERQRFDELALQLYLGSMELREPEKINPEKAGELVEFICQLSNRAMEYRINWHNPRRYIVA